MWWEWRLHDSNIDGDYLVHLKILRPCVRQLVMLNGHLSHLLGLSSNHLWRISDKVGRSYHGLSASIKIWACRSPSSWSRSLGPCRARQVASDSHRCTIVHVLSAHMLKCISTYLYMFCVSSNNPSMSKITWVTYIIMERHTWYLSFFYTGKIFGE